MNDHGLTLTHTHIDIYGAHNLQEVHLVEQVLSECVRTAGCQLVHIHVHKFPEEGGVSGFALIAESHFSIHTWPELSFAAIDFFTCGQSDALTAIPILEEAFSPSSLNIQTYHRGHSDA